MRVIQSFEARAGNIDPAIESLLEVSAEWLKSMVETISVPRHYKAESENNRRVAEWIEGQLRSFGYRTDCQGAYGNIITVPEQTNQPLMLIGAHYDSVPGTPGADDNASAVAAMLACARAIAHDSRASSVCFVAFNREEDNRMGSRDFVTSYLPTNDIDLQEVHVLEMVGYCDSTPGSQRLPKGLPIQLARETGDFLGLIGNNRSNHLVDRVLCCAKTYMPEFPVLGLKVYLGLERLFPDLRRSDHAPFWDVGIPALMWTDTAEFRNPHYHQSSDTPETLDYGFLQAVAQLLIVRALSARHA